MVNCLTLEQVVAMYLINRIDILQIDAEDYDYQIIKSLDFTKISPRSIIYEHAGLAKLDKEQCDNYLRSMGYSILIDKSDTLATKENMNYWISR